MMGACCLWRKWERRAGAAPARPRRRRLAALLLWAALPVAAATAPPDLQPFLDAEHALQAGDRQRFEDLAAALSDHPLYPYLALTDLLGRLDTAEADEVNAFIERYADTAPGERLRLNWLRRLAREERWPEYITAYVDNGSETRECLYRRALLATGQRQAAFHGLEALYHTGASLPAACDPLLADWSASGGLPPAQVWQRIDLALARANAGVAAYQGRYLPEAQQPWLERLLRLHQRPRLLLSQPLTAAQVPDPERRGALITHAIVRLARLSPTQAVEALSGAETNGELTQEQRERARVAVGTALAAAGDRAALAQLARLQPRPDNAEIQLERLRAARALEAWPELAHWARDLPPGADQDGEWAYWRGRALALGGNRIGAAHAFAEAAGARSLWGFLAAELLGRPPALHHVPAPASPGGIEVLLGSETAERIRALRRLGRQADVRREWRALTRGLSDGGLITAAVAADRLGLTNESILTLARSGYWDDLTLRFPLAHRSLVTAAAAEHGLPQDWVYAVIRQESAFDADAASAADAIGLMQLLPSTARQVASRLGLAPPRRLDLIDPALNIRLGSAYLAAMRTRFGGRSLLATAAYNAGPNAARRWLADEPLPGDLWLTRIPYRETRDYVRRVLTYRVVYRARLGLPPLHLHALLSPVGKSHGESVSKSKIEIRVEPQ